MAIRPATPRDNEATPNAHGFGSPDDRRRVLARLRSVAGHVKGVERMVGDGAYCIDIVRQTIAIQRALDKVNAILLEDHLEHCAAQAMRSGDHQQRARTIREILEVFEMSSRL